MQNTTCNCLQFFHVSYFPPYLSLAPQFWFAPESYRSSEAGTRQRHHQPLNSKVLLGQFSSINCLSRPFVLRYKAFPPPPPRELIRQCFQDCCQGKSVPIAPSLPWQLLGPLQRVSVSWLQFPRLNNLSKCREFPSDKGRGTVTGKLWLPFLKCISSCPSRQLQTPLKSAGTSVLTLAEFESAQDTKVN